MKIHPIEAIKAKLQKSRRIAITSHLRPDGDSICTSLALYYMGKLGKFHPTLTTQSSFSNVQMSPVPVRKISMIHLK
jgi:nanoRNase/pAp phosphatase (c-di-AMP/oligoRNAs hydrolase)